MRGTAEDSLNPHAERPCRQLCVEVRQPLRLLGFGQPRKPLDGQEALAGIGACGSRERGILSGGSTRVGFGGGWARRGVEPEREERQTKEEQEAGGSFHSAEMLAENRR